MPLPRSSSLANPVAALPRCFCGRPIDNQQDEPAIYCSTSCARLDSMSALCAQEVLESSPKGRMKQVFRLGVKEALAKSSHYRRTEREGNKTKKKLVGKGIGAIRAETKHEPKSVQEEDQQATLTLPTANEVYVPAGRLLQPKPSYGNLKQPAASAHQRPQMTQYRASPALRPESEYGDDEEEFPMRHPTKGDDRPPVVLHSYFSSSSLASKLSSAASSSSLSSFSSGELAYSASNGSLASSASNSSSLYASSSTSPLSISKARSAVEKSNSRALPSSPSLDSLFTPLGVQDNAFHSNLLRSSFFNDRLSEEKDEQETPRIGSKSPCLEMHFESMWSKDRSEGEGGESSLGDFLKSF